MDWTEETIAHLRALWAEGHSTAEIGRRMAISKNAVVGKAHRLQLTARPSPIRRGGAPVRRSAPRPPAPVLPAPEAAPVTVAPLVEHPQPAALRAVAAPVRSAGRTMPCCWPIGEPGSPSFRFCDEPAMSGKPYCEAHAQLAYVKVRDRREDAA
jgi:GcrA cell cycle regulator